MHIAYNVKLIEKIFQLHVPASTEEQSQCPLSSWNGTTTQSAKIYRVKNNNLPRMHPLQPVPFRPLPDTEQPNGQAKMTDLMACTKQ